MANIIATNFGEFSTNITDFFTLNASGATFVSASYANFFPNGNGQVFNNTNNTGSLTKGATVPSASEYYAHIRHRLGTGGESQGLIGFNEGSTNHIDVIQNADGTISVRRNATVIATGTTVFSVILGRVLSVQVHVVIHDTTGVVQVRINGQNTNEIDFSGDTRNGGTGVINIIGPRTVPNDQTAQWTDFIVNDTTGSFENSWPGAARVVLAPLSVAGSLAQWTPLSSTNVSNIDDAVPGANDAETTYIEDSTVGHKDYYTLGATVFSGMSPTQIRFVVVKTWARAADGGSHSFRANALRSATTVNGATQLLSSTYAMYEERFYQDPATTAAWASFANIIATEFGPELVT
jgi:hypothetical protein